jgi:CRP/FNR family transcriptional regulator, cyclic AMP receptor protein
MAEITRVQHKDGVWEVTWRFDDTSFHTLSTLAEEKVFPSGHIVFREGDAPDGMYLILDGSAVIVRRTSTGEERAVGIITEGQSFGELGLLSAHPRRATISAGTDLRVLKITATVLDLLHASAPDIAYMMYRALAQTLAEQLLQTQDMQSPQ